MTFLDTGFLFALISTRDEHHARVVEVFQTFQGVRLSDQLVTTNHVVAETITLTRKVGHAEAARLGDRLYGERLARIHWATPDEERAAFDYFKRHSDQAYSFVEIGSEDGVRRGDAVRAVDDEKLYYSASAGCRRPGIRSSRLLRRDDRASKRS